MIELLDKAVLRLKWILEEAKIGILEIDNNGASTAKEKQIVFTLSSGVLITVLMGERTEVSILGDKIVPCPVFEIGYMKLIPGGYWEPDDADYVPVEDTANIFDAVSSAMLLSEKWKIDSMLESISIQEINFRYDTEKFVPIKQEDIIKNGGC